MLDLINQYATKFNYRTLNLQTWHWQSYVMYRLYVDDLLLMQSGWRTPAVAQAEMERQLKLCL